MGLDFDDETLSSAAAEGLKCKMDDRNTRRYIKMQRGFINTKSTLDY